MATIIDELQAIRSRRFGGVGFHCGGLIAEQMQEARLSHADEDLAKKVVAEALVGTTRANPMYITDIAEKVEYALPPDWHPQMYAHNGPWDIAFRAAMALGAADKAGYIPPVTGKTHAFYLK